jgi:FkbM family methyltransferase
MNAQYNFQIPLMFAATETDGEFEFNYSDAGFCNGGFHENESDWRHAHAFKLKVTGKNLLSYLRQTNAAVVPKIRFVKVDAEGFDFAILKTLEELIFRNRPYIKAEVYKNTTLAAREQFFDFLSNFDYDIFYVENETNYCGQLIKKENLNDWKHYDIFCVPAEKADDR